MEGGPYSCHNHDSSSQYVDLLSYNNTPHHLHLPIKVSTIIAFFLVIGKYIPLSTHGFQHLILHRYIFMEVRPDIGSQPEELLTLSANQLMIKLSTKPNLILLAKTLGKLKDFSFKFHRLKYFSLKFAKKLLKMLIMKVRLNDKNNTIPGG